MKFGGIHPLLISNIEKNIVAGKKVLCIVPSIRYKKNILGALKENLNGVFKAPKILSFAELAKHFFWEERLNSFQEQIFFFNYLKTIEPDLEFKEFKKWGPTLLKDFDLLDNYLLSSENLGRLMKEVYELDIELHHEITDLQIFQKETLPIKKKFLQIWTQFQSLYQGYNDYLKARGKQRGAYQMRLLSEGNDLVEGLDYDEVFFMEFNAITQCEKAIIKKLKAEKGAKFYMSIQKKWLQQKQVLAAYFAQLHQDIIDVVEEVETPQIPVSVIGVGQEVEQVYYVMNAIQQDLQNGFKPESIAVILGEESLALPFLQNLKGFPINMGVAFKAAFNAGDKWVDQWLSFRKELKLASKSETFYQRYYAWVEKEKIDETVFFRSLGTEVQKGDEILKKAMEHLEASGQYAIVLKEMEKQLAYIAEEHLYFDEEVFFAVYQEAQKNANLYYKGDPETSVQVLGLLETRGLSFDKIYFLNLKEGAIPDTSLSSSFIPYEYYTELGLPMQQQKEALFANYFYNLLDASKEAVLMYPAKKMKEDQSPSRFIEQVVYFGQQLNYKVKEYKLPVANEFYQVPSKAIENQDCFKSAMDKWLNKISPTSLTAYQDCPRDFFYKHILKIREDKSKGILEANDFGTILHQFIEDLLKPYEGEIINKELWKKIVKGTNVENGLRELFLAHVKKEELLHKGKVYMGYNAAVIYIKSFLRVCEKELSNNEWQLIQNEIKLRVEIPEVAAFEGTMDRVDKLNGQVRIIDYKTSNISNSTTSELKIKNISQLFEGNKSKAFQLMFYQWLYYKQTGELPQAYLYMLKQMGEKALMQLSVNNEGVKEEHILEFESLLFDMVDKIKEQVSFDHNPKAKYCLICPE